MKEKDLEGPTELGVTSCDVRRSVRNFMKSFWVKFGRAEARRAMICYFFSSLPFFVACYSFPRLCVLCLLCL
jgi:hypothetical protein